MRTADTTLTPARSGRTFFGTSALLAVLLAAVLLLGACGTELDTSTKQAGQSSSDVPIAVGDSDLGEILVGKDGLTLYGFTNDVDAKSTCDGACADAWPPVIVDPGWTPGPGLDPGIFATTPRADGSLQLVAGKWPLYYYTEDMAAGDLTGQGSGEVWYVVASDGTLIKDGVDEFGDLDELADLDELEGLDELDELDGLEDGIEEGDDEAGGDVDPTSAAVQEGDTDLGPVLVDGDGRTLYGFTGDTGGEPTCDDGSAETWSPLTVGDGELPEGLDPDVFSVVERTDGTTQLRAGVWPLYRFSGDAEAGETNGQGTDDKWFAVGPDGILIEDGAPDPALDAAPDESPDESPDDSGY